MNKLYSYPTCSTCKKAQKYLVEKQIGFKAIHIVELPPSKGELKRMLKSMDGNMKRLLNTSGQVYREMNLKEKLPNMSDDEVLSLLAENGKLIKRPFFLGEKGDLIGFKEAEWEELL